MVVLDFSTALWFYDEKMLIGHKTMDQIRAVWLYYLIQPEFVKGKWINGDNICVHLQYNLLYSHVHMFPISLCET